MVSTVSGLAGRLNPWRRRVARAELVDALRAHAGLVLGAAARILGSTADAEDVAQDIAERLLRSPPGEVRSWPALLKRMAVNAAIDRLRRERPTAPEPVSELPADPAAEPEAALLDRQRAEALRAAVATLEDRDARLFALCCFADLSHAEIGAELGMTANAVGVALHRLKRRLATDIDDRLGTREDGGA